MGFSLTQLDGLTGGAFSAPTSGERAACVRLWLATDPAPELMQEVFKELSAKDKGAAKLLRERLDELKRAKSQESLALEWAEKAQALLLLGKINMADAMAWQRDAAKAGAPLSKEPLLALKERLAQRVAHIEGLQHQSQVQREAALMLAQRLEMCSTKPWGDADAALPALRSDVAAWQAQAAGLATQADWGSVDAKYPAQMQAAGQQLELVLTAFAAALEQTRAAAQDAQAPLPQVPVWAEELRAARAALAQASGTTPAHANEAKNKIDPEQRKAAVAAVRSALKLLEQELEKGHGKASVAAASAVRSALKEHGSQIDAKTDFAAQSALTAAAELEGWQRWRANQIREDLIGKAKALQEGNLQGRQLQTALRELREQWKLTDQGGMANHAMWKQFDEACSSAHQAVEAWQQKARAQEAQHKAGREALLTEVQAWTQANAARSDWRAVMRELHGFAERWRSAGHLGEKLYEKMQAQWKAAIKAAHAGLEVAQAASIEGRRAMIDESAQLAAQAPLHIDAVKALQARWQAEAQAVPLDRKLEQKLWDAFRQPIDAAFARKSQARAQAQAASSAHDQAVLDAVAALDAANASGDAQQIHAAMAALQAAVQGQRPAGVVPPQDLAAETVATVAVAAGAVVGAASEAQAEQNSEQSSEQSSEQMGAASAPEASAAIAKKPVRAMRGDDRPGAQKTAATRAAPAAKARANDRFTKRGDDRGREGREGRAGRDARDGGLSAKGGKDDSPRLSNQAFYAQREALDRAQAALKKLSAQAHGESLLQLIEGWKMRNGEQIPAAAKLSKTLSPQWRAKWVSSVGQGAQATAASTDAAAVALLRLEMAADAPTPAEHLPARRALQLQLLTQRHQAAPSQTWGEDVATVLASAHEENGAKRLQAALAQLLKE